MKILFFLPRAGRTGSEVVVYNLICNADRQKMKMAVTCPVDGSLLRAFPPDVSTFTHTSDEQIKLIHEQVKPDAWYINTIVQPSILQLARKLDVPCVLHTHELEQMLIYLTPEAAEEMVSYPKLVIAASEAAAEVMRVLGRKKAMEICYESIDVKKVRSQPGASTEIRTALGINADDFVWAMSGTLDTNKNPVLFVEIADSLLRKNPRAHFIWIGGSETAYSRFAKARALSLGLDEKIKWIPPRVDDYYDYLDVADGFVLTSTRDCFPLVMIEIAALGKPIVSFDSGGVREFFRPGMGAVIKDSWNISDIVAAMIQVMDKEVNFDRRISRERAAEFDVSVQVKHWESLLESHLKPYLLERDDDSKRPKDELNPLSLDVPNDNPAISKDTDPDSSPGVEELSARTKELESKVESLSADLTAEQQKTAALEARANVAESEEIRVLSSQLGAKTQELDRITRSAGWRLLSLYGPIKYKFVKPLFRFFKSPGRDQPSVKAHPEPVSTLPDPVTETIQSPGTIVLPGPALADSPMAERRRAHIDIVLCAQSKIYVVRQCLQSVIQFANQPYSLILVDNGTDEETRKYLVDFGLAEGARLLRNDLPKGLALTADKGLRHSNADYVLLLSSDRVVTPGLLERMMACADSDIQIGLVASAPNAHPRQPFNQMLQSDGLAKNNSVPDGAKPTHTYTALDETSVYPRLPLNGICLMIKREVINEVGYFDNEASVEDWSDGETDYCSRAGRAGWKLALTDVQG